MTSNRQPSNTGPGGSEGDSLSELLGRTVGWLAACKFSDAVTNLRVAAAEARRRAGGLVMGHTVTVLQHLTALLHFYCSLSFVSKKPRFRTFGPSQVDRVRELVVATREAIRSHPASPELQALDTALGALVAYVATFRPAMDVYVKLAHGRASSSTYGEAAHEAGQVLAMLKAIPPGPLDPLVAVRRHELQVLRLLLAGHGRVEAHVFLDATLGLARAHSTLQAWTALAPPQGGPDTGSNHVQGWLGELLGLLGAKHSLYFHALLAGLRPADTAPPGTRWPHDHVRSIEQFCRRNEGAIVSLLFNARHTPFSPTGYQLPGPMPQLDGLASVPVFFSWPKELGRKQQINVVVLVLDGWPRMAQTGRTEYLRDDLGPASTHYVAAIDANVCLAVTQMARRPPDDPATTAFMAELLGLLRPAGLVGGLVGWGK